MQEITYRDTIYSLVAQIVRLKDVRNVLYERFVPVGAGYDDRYELEKKGYKWKEINTAFRNCVLTGAIINEDRFSQISGKHKKYDH